MKQTIPINTAILEMEMEEARPIQVAQIYDKEENPMNGRVYDADGIAPTLRTPTGGLSEPKIMQIGSYSPSSACNAKVLDTDGICPTLLDHKGAEPAILTPIRTEEQRQLRKQGIDTFGGRQMLPRTDGVSNTITTVQKDNLLLEPCQVIGSMQANAMRGSIDGVSPCLTEAMGMGGGQIPMIVQNAHGYNKGGIQNYHEREVAGTIHTSSGSGGNTDQFVKTRYRIRKLTPSECLRLMDCDDEDIQRILNAQVPQVLKSGKVKYKPLPKTAAYKLAGNSICVAPLYYIFKAMFVDEPPRPKPIQNHYSTFNTINITMESEARYGVTAICEAPKDTMKVKIKKLHPDAVIPTKAHPSDAGFDLTATWSGWNNANKVFEYGFGLSFEIPKGYVGLIFPRSSIYRKDLFLTNCVGVVDSGFRGEVTAKFKSISGRVPESYNVGERVAQMIILPYPEITFVESDTLTDTDRGTGGYGSTGV